MNILNQDDMETIFGSALEEIYESAQAVKARLDMANGSLSPHKYPAAVLADTFSNKRLLCLDRYADYFRDYSKRMARLQSCQKNASFRMLQAPPSLSETWVWMSQPSPYSILTTQILTLMDS